MVPRHNSKGFGLSVDRRPGVVWRAKAVGDQHRNSVALIAPRPQTGPINRCDRSVPQRMPCLLMPIDLEDINRLATEADGLGNLLDMLCTPLLCVSSRSV